MQYGIVHYNFLKRLTHILIFYYCNKKKVILQNMINHRLRIQYGKIENYSRGALNKIL